MWKGWAEYKHQISSVFNIVCFAIDICWTILCKTFLETNEKRMTLSGSPWPKWGDGNYTWLMLKPSSRGAFITLCEAVNCFSSLSMLCPFVPGPCHPPPPQGESWYCLSLKSLVLRTTESLLMTLSSVWIKKSPGRGDVLVPAPFRSSGVMQQERRCRQFGSCTGNKLECLFKHSWWKGLRFWGAKWCSVVKFYSVESKMWVLREAKEHISQNCRGQMCSLCGKYSHEHTSSAWLSWDGWSRLKPEYESSSVQCEFVCL